MSQAGKRTRRHFTPKEKVAILKRHLVDQVPVSDLCDELNLQPRLFYRWQQEFFEKGAVYSIGQCNILPTNLIIGDVAHGSNGTTRIVRVTEVGGMASMEERPVA